MMNKNEQENDEMIESAISFLKDYLHSGNNDKDDYLEFAIDLITCVINKHSEEEKEQDLTDWTEMFREETTSDKIREFIDRTNEIYNGSKLSIGFVADINSYLVYSDNEIVASINADRHVSFLCKKYNVELVYLLNLIDFSGVFL